MQHARIQPLNDRETARRPLIVYWMQASVRSRHNHALEYAVHLAHQSDRAPVVVFGLAPDYPGANARHYTFLLQALADVADDLALRGISFSVWAGAPARVALLASQDAAALVTDVGYLRHLRRWRSEVAAAADCPVIQVESNVVVPVAEASLKQEYSAATLRGKLVPQIAEYATEVRTVAVGRRCGHEVLAHLAAALPHVDVLGTAPQELVPPSIAATPGPVADRVGGQTEAARLLQTFLDERIDQYDAFRNHPDRDLGSRLSAHLHFGSIAPSWIVLSVRERFPPGASPDADAFLEELVVRRELAINFCHYNADYDRFAVLPDWARRTLHEHRADPRPMRYSARRLEAGETHDEFWNACQRQMVRSGYMHGYMRMYWGKKILEWTPDPEDAFALTIALNDRYELDGRDPNGYTGVAWCYGLHDRPWVERPVFGKVRYMNANGIKRKFKRIGDYLARWR